jgi:4-phytase/acid phosphatase/peptide/nickel transport system substrate-binding protein
LVTLDDKGEPQPKLALSWTHSDDFKTWTFKLRPGVKFHDGTPFNAQAVKENFDRQKEPANKCRCAFYIAYVHDLEVLDDLTVVYHLNDPQVNQPALMTLQSSNNVVHSPTAWKTKGDDYNRNPVGTGPYILKSWAAGDRMVLERNPDYWNKGHPYLDRIVLKPLPDAQSRFASLQSGEADIVWDEAEGAHLFGVGGSSLRLQHQGRAVRRCPCAAGDGDGARPQEVLAGDHQRSGASRQQSLWRWFLGQVQG